MKKYKYKIGTGELEDRNGDFDEWLYHEALFGRNIIIGAFFYSIFGLLFAIFVFQEPLMLFFTLLLSFMAFIVGSIYFIMFSKNKSFCKMMDLHRRLKKVPEEIKTNARIHYPKNWRECAIECYESHITGDCLLCEKRSEE